LIKPFIHGPFIKPAVPELIIPWQEAGASLQKTLDAVDLLLNFILSSYHIPCSYKLPQYLHTGVWDFMRLNKNRLNDDGFYRKLQDNPENRIDKVKCLHCLEAFFLHIGGKPASKSTDFGL
jgi:hypothetical protein